jgi:hypothetical protein
MIRTFALITVFAVSLFAVPTKSTTNIVPTPECAPNCPNLPWSN